MMQKSDEEAWVNFISSCIGLVVICFFNGLISFLFYASIILMKESKLAISAVNKEMDYTIKVIREGIPNL